MVVDLFQEETEATFLLLNSSVEGYFISMIFQTRRNHVTSRLQERTLDYLACLNNSATQISMWE